MWPFRRRLSVSSPELVSANPISQDGVAVADNTNQRIYSQEESTQEKVANWTTNTIPPTSVSCNRKSISTWGRKVGKKWNDIKRADSSELLSVSSTRRHWSPNRQGSNEFTDDSQQNLTTNFLKPKRILRVKSLRHLFRHSDKSHNSSMVEDSKSATIKEEEGVYTDYKLDKSFSDGLIRIPQSFKDQMNDETLSNRKRIFSHSIHDIDKRNQLDYFIDNTNTIKSKIEPDVATSTLRKNHDKCESVMDLTKNTFNAPNDNKDRNEHRKSVISSGLEELVNNMKIGCDESGYDSDSTRTGADSPDCEKSNLKVRSYSLTSEDYRTVEMMDPKTDQRDRTKSNIESDNITETVDAETVEGNVSAVTEETSLDMTLRADEDDPDKTLVIDSNRTVRFDLEESLTQQIPKKKCSSFRITDVKPTRKKHKNKDSSTVNLLDESASPCKDTPPIHKVLNSASPTVPYYSTKRPRNNLDVSFEEAEFKQMFKRPAMDVQKLRREKSNQTYSESLFRMEYKMIKFDVKPGNIGITISEKENGRSGYVVSRMDPAGCAAKSGLFRLGDEIVRVRGKRLRRMGIVEAKNALQNCSGNVDIHIGRRPALLNFTEERPTFDWPEAPSNASSVMADEEVWSRKDPNSTEPSCEIVGFLKKDGMFLAVDDFGELKEPAEKVTGMKKFHVRKRANNTALRSRRTVSLSMDLLTIVLEKGSKKKLGFTIVGGSDSDKGNYGIYVKNISQGGQAANCLRTGDEILALNNVPMEGLTHEQALQVFKSAKPGEIVINVRRKESAHLKRLHKL